MLTPLYSGPHARMSEAAFDRALEELTSSSLISWGEFETRDQYLNMHQLVQEVMRGRLSEQEMAGAIADLAIKVVESTYDETSTFEGNARNLQWLPTAMAALPHAPRDGAAARHTLWTRLQTGDLYVERGNLSEALEAYQSSLAISERLASADRGNAGWQRDLSVSQEKIGDVLRAQGNLSEALEAYQSSLAISERLASADRGNAGWQRDLSVSQEKIGDVLQGNLLRAIFLKRLRRTSRRLRYQSERLASADRGNAGWQRDLSVSHNKIGDVLVEDRRRSGLR